MGGNNTFTSCNEKVKKNDNSPNVREESFSPGCRREVKPQHRAPWGGRIWGKAHCRSQQAKYLAAGRPRAWWQSLSLPEQSTHFRKSPPPGRASCAGRLDVKTDCDCCTHELSWGRLGCESAQCFMGTFHLSTSSGESPALPHCFSLFLFP